MTDKKSVIIMGGGLGGLFTGAILAKEGLHVTVLEKNATVGGGLQSFKRFGEVFDTGMHIIGGMQKGGNVHRICEYLGIWNRVHVKAVDREMMDRIYVAEDKTYYRIPQGRQEYVDALSAQFPHQAENIRAYVDAMYKVADEVDLFYLRKTTNYFPVHSDDFLMSATAFIDKYLTDRKLRNVVSYMNSLYGGRDNFTPAYMHCLISVLYIDGACRFAGGSQLFADTLADCIREHGGEVFTNEAVEAIHTENRLVTGVRSSKGRELSADYYVCNIHPCTMFKLLDDPKALPKPYRERLDGLPNAYSAFTLNIKFKSGTVKYFNHVEYYMTKYDDMWSFDKSDKKWPLGFLYMTPPEVQQGEYATKMIITAPMTWDHVAKWENTTVGKRGEEYEQWKKECAEKLLSCIEEVFPDIRQNIEATNTASPLTIRDYYAVKEGSMCGFAKDWHDLMLTQVPVVTKIPNLLLTGQNCNLHGFCGVALTSINTSEAILGQDSVLDKL